MAKKWNIVASETALASDDEEADVTLMRYWMDMLGKFHEESAEIEKTLAALSDQLIMEIERSTYDDAEKIIRSIFSDNKEGLTAEKKKHEEK